ncbi:MAG: delta-lactam-biosynthetic de-N-acetylase [Bacillota bacterium]|nr:delta-lactam-biosynthetic de-N-acetylase [Bacillota bacterium]
MKKIFVQSCLMICLTLIVGGCSSETQTITQNPPVPKPSVQAPLPLDNKTFSWYVVRNKEHKQPRGNTEGAFDLQKYDAYFTGPTTQKVIFLTFDEGYENGYTPQILDTLKRHQVPACFFVTEPYITSNPELIKRMVKEGHIVGNHSKTHPSMPSVTGDPAAFKNEIEETADAFREQTGKKMPLYFRPPKGEFSEKSLYMTQQLKYKTIFWSFAYEDWLTDKQPSPDSALKKILDNTHNGEIMLLHAVSSTNAAILDQVITEIKKQGYTFKSLDELK